MPATNSGYAGDVAARSAFEALETIPAAVLVDVRTRAEWSYVGVPSLAGIGKETIFVSWDDFCSGTLVPDFAGRLKAVLDEKGVAADAPVYFICRSGARSRNAAVAATAAGYANCFNVESGFEGALGPDRHRATPGSWKGDNLPWTQT